jgi:hypothetical protein
MVRYKFCPSNKQELSLKIRGLNAGKGLPGGHSHVYLIYLSGEVVLGFEITALCLLGSCPWVTPLALSNTNWTNVL